MFVSVVQLLPFLTHTHTHRNETACLVSVKVFSFKK